MGNVDNEMILQAIRELSGQFTGMKERVDSVENRFDSMEERFDKRFDTLEQKIDKMDTKLDLLNEAILKTKANVRILQRTR